MTVASPLQLSLHAPSWVRERTLLLSMTDHCVAVGLSVASIDTVPAVDKQTEAACVASEPELLHGDVVVTPHGASHHRDKPEVMLRSPTLASCGYKPAPHTAASLGPV